MSASKIKFVKTIPANPGFYVLEAIEDDKGYPVETDKSHVVAWALDDDLFLPYPITLYGVRTENVYILQPDGTVELPNVCWFLSEDSWLKTQQQKYTEKHSGAA